jgi:2-dehydropantoate 2-reductase
MKFCIFGGGSIGGLLAHGLNKIGLEVSVVARGAHLDAIKNYGLTIIDPDGETETSNLLCSENTYELGIQDFLFITIKSHALVPSLQQIKPLIGDNTTIVTCMNGIPHWYFHEIGNKFQNIKIKSLDKDELINKVIHPEKIIGAVVYPASTIVKPGVIKHLNGNRFSLGEPSGILTDRINFLSKTLKEAGFRAPIQRNIRDEIWLKLIGNLSFNPISALTGASLVDICNDPGTEKIVREMMQEAKLIAERLGAKISLSIEKRIDGARKVGAHKTSMLQDIEAKKPIEINSILFAVKELGELAEIECPQIDTILSLISQKARLIDCL